jgi:hypothetical protein
MNAGPPYLMKILDDLYDAGGQWQLVQLPCFTTPLNNYFIERYAPLGEFTVRARLEISRSSSSDSHRETRPQGNIIRVILVLGQRGTRNRFASGSGTVALCLENGALLDSAIVVIQC